MNVADTERMQAILVEKGLEMVSAAENADVIIINGCSVREKAVHKAISALGRYQFLKNGPEKKKPQKMSKTPVIGLGGCVGQLEKEQIFEKAPYLDFVFGPDRIDDLPEMIDRVEKGQRYLSQVDFDDRKVGYSTETKILADKSQAFVNIMKGCDKFCTYCIVPFTRGREKSRPIDEVLDDIASLVAQGVKEVTLLGQNVNSFGKGTKNIKQRLPLELHNVIGKVGPNEGEENFPQLLRAIDDDPRMKNLKRIRFTSSHPLDFSDELIECYAAKGGVSKLSSYLHLPVQSGSDRVLKKMGRHHKIENYIAQMDRLKEINPEVAITTDLIVGFPTETEQEFEETLVLLDRIEYDSVYAFAYSERPGTKAAKMEDDIPKKEKMRRLNLLFDHQKKISLKRNAMHVGKTLEILVENKAKNNLMAPGKEVWSGRADSNRIVNFTWESPRDLKGKLILVKITGFSGFALEGEPVIDSTVSVEAEI